MARRSPSVFTIIAPGILVAATGVGAGDLLTATLAGSGGGPGGPLGGPGGSYSQVDPQRRPGPLATRNRLDLAGRVGLESGRLDSVGLPGLSHPVHAAGRRGAGERLRGGRKRLHPTQRRSGSNEDHLGRHSLIRRLCTGALRELPVVRAVDVSLHRGDVRDGRTDGAADGAGLGGDRGAVSSHPFRRPDRHGCWA